MTKKSISMILAGLLYLVGISSFIYADELEDCDQFVIPRASIETDGFIDDWNNIPPVFVDEAGDEYEGNDFDGTDLDKFYMARDDNFLYLLITLNDGPPKTDITTQYGFEANFLPNQLSTPSTHLAKAYFRDGLWHAGVHVRSTTGGGDIAFYPSHFVGGGSNFLEWKVAFPDMGILEGKYAHVYIHNSEADVSDRSEVCIQLKLKDPPVVNQDIIIYGCDTDVPDQVYQDRLVSEWIYECSENQENHGQFVRCVTELTINLKKEGLITGSEHGSIMSCAARAEIP